MATFFIKHTTRYTYSDNVVEGNTLTKLHPINDQYQKVSSHLISITNNPVIDTFFDFYNNRVGTFMIIEPHNSLNIVSEIEVTTTEKPLPIESSDISIEWDALKPLKKDQDFIDFLSYKPFKGSCINCFTAFAAQFSVSVLPFLMFNSKLYKYDSWNP